MPRLARCQFVADVVAQLYLVERSVMSMPRLPRQGLSNLPGGISEIRVPRPDQTGWGAQDVSV